MLLRDSVIPRQRMEQDVSVSLTKGGNVSLSKEAPGLAMYVDSIKHQTLSHSFALLHVGAAEGSLH